ncbi:erythromycin esterase family protein [Methanolobus mangrovi]|uniref:Erythromycin esterase family protein n=1 Tax=Methanolobus mangrovi TaxID=3072977 RepID=A0AA51UGP3_9EURY|nr:erythromycin esterase family protein [Methanolobus mangrovi]WMW21371.1 erythromycin esterase family protein [Methanolobus mangrovi]
MSHPVPIYSTLADWIQQAAIPFSLDSSETFSAAVDRLIASLDDSVELLGFGEALHGGEEILMLRNQLFKYLVKKYGYSAIAIESSFPRAHIVNEYVAGRGPASYEDIQEAGFSHGFGRLEANRELVKWMREYNADPSHQIKIRFYGFDSPSEMMYADSPRHLLHFVLDYLTSVDSASGRYHHEQIDPLLGNDAEWENPAAAMDPTRSVGLSSNANALRIETEDLISEINERRPELVDKTSDDQYLKAVQYATVARQLLNYHAVSARNSDDRLVRLLGIRDAMMADNLTYIVSRERSRGKVLAFAHNSHLKRGKTHMQLGPYALKWWPAGSHLYEMFGPRYAIISSGVGVSEENGIGLPQSGTLEALLTGLPEPALFIPTHKGQGLPASEIAALPTRLGSIKNPTYFPFTSEDFTDFDWLVILDSTTYGRGGPQLQ